MALTFATGGAENSGQPTYRIDYDGKKYRYCAEAKNGERIDPPEQARVGEMVVIYYPMIATDTDYSFRVDGMYFQPDYQTEKGFIFRFVMPDHDITIQCNERNSMLPDIDADNVKPQ